jgi:hypothetical protein
MYGVTHSIAFQAVLALANHGKRNELRETDVSDLSEAGATRAQNGSDTSDKSVSFLFPEHANHGFFLTTDNTD